eukprot:TRINITY_DN755_c0_g1_i1.p1 TRINITY_DN755_c0_g1~~TRINITY_DN755_c0_g1_i1.p1  ORF type:complete len:121 (-),score=22.55 TRINITY_DN755_c0_g1_i1:105-467(-)
MGGVSLSNWAAMIAISGAWFLIAGAVSGLFYPNPLPAYYSFAAGAIVLILFWPLPLGCVVFLSGNHIVNGIVLAGLSAFSYFLPATLIGALTLDIAAILFWVAAYKKEPSQIGRPPPGRG